jgi:hypothetical protein
VNYLGRFVQHFFERLRKGNAAMYEFSPSYADECRAVRAEFLSQSQSLSTILSTEGDESHVHPTDQVQDLRGLTSSQEGDPK